MKLRLSSLFLSLYIIIGCLCGCDAANSTPTFNSNFSYQDDEEHLNDDNETTTTEPTTTTTKKTTTTTTKKITTTTTTKKLTTTTTTKKPTTTTTTKKLTTTTSSEPLSDMVWIPASGKKYHSNPSCSNMKNPSKISKARAKEMGYTPCKKCYG